MAKYRPWFPVTVRPDNQPSPNPNEIRKCDAVALQALSRGTATEQQQQMAFKAILYVCGLQDLGWVPEEHGGDRDSSFAAGKRFIGLQLNKISKFPISTLTGQSNDGRGHDRSTGKPADDRNATRAKQ